MENNEFKKIIDKLKLLKMFITIKEIVKILRYIHSEKICTPMKIRLNSELKKSAIYDYLGIFIDTKLIIRYDLPRIHEDGSRYMVKATRRLKGFLEDLDNYTKGIIA